MTETPDPAAQDDVVAASADDAPPAITAAPEPAPAKPENSVKSLLWLALFAWVLRSLVFAPFSIPSGSMLPNMEIGDYLFVAKWPYGFSRYSFPWQIPPVNGRLFEHLPKRGDIVVFRRPGDENTDVVKRVIGLPGDTVAVDNGVVLLNGKPLPRVALGLIAIPVTPNSECRMIGPGTPRLGRADGAAACLYPAFRETLPDGTSYTVLDQLDSPQADHFAPQVIPDGDVFLMGDNRDDSLDSRFAPEDGGMGLVPTDHLVGRATIRFWSTDGSASWLNPISWFTALRARRIGGTY